MPARVMVAPEEGMEVIKKLTADLKSAAKLLTDTEARYLVDAYYALQGYRVGINNQITALEKSGEPNDVLKWFFNNADMLEGQMKKALDSYSESKVVGRWAKSICGIGPVLSAGLLAHVDMNKAPTVGHIWRYAGMDPTTKWIGREAAEALVTKVAKENPDLDNGKKGKTVSFDFVVKVAQEAKRDPRKFEMYVDKDTKQFTLTSLVRGLSRRPWNGDLKTLCWKIGESFMKTHNLPQDYYGKLYASRKAWETEKNLNKDYEAQAVEKLANFKIGHGTDAYKAYVQGLLPDGRINERAKRYAVKIFLSHWHAVAFETTFGRPAPTPYVLAYRPEHVHMLTVPNWPIEEQK